MQPHEHPVNDDIVTAIVDSLLPDHPPVDDVAYLPGGYSNDNYRITMAGTDYALRVTRISPPARFERAFLELAIAPEVVAYDATLGHMISRWIDGALVVAAPMTATEAAEYLRDLHDAVPAGITAYDVASRICENLDAGRSPDSTYELLEEIDWQPARSVGCHNDLNPWNIIRTDEGFRTLDWEFAGDNDPIFDVVGFCHGALFDDDRLTAVVAAYAPDLDADYLRRTKAIFQLREHAWAVGQLANGNNRAEIIEQRDSCLLAAEQLAASERGGHRPR